MIFIFSETHTKRLKYVCHFILKEQLGLDFSIITNIDDCHDKDKIIINYSHIEILGNILNIKPHKLLFESNIQAQNIDVFTTNDLPAFFKIGNSDTTFDIFAAVFYLISRYEEYLPHKKDEYGRYAHENSIAFKNGFLNKPLVNLWIEEFSKKIQEKKNDLIIKRQSFHTTITYDIDMAWSFKNKGLFRNIGGFLKKPSSERLKVLLKKANDPFDCYAFLDECFKKKQLDVIYFFLVAEKSGIYDKNTSPKNKEFRILISELAKKYNIGLHPSWKSYFSGKELLNEKSTLEFITEKKTINSRQHYIKFTLPDTFRKLINIGIEKDFSMGYGTINGFRASVASSFLWYDLQQENISKLRLFPFCFMDANCHYEQKLTIEQSSQELDYYTKECKQVNGLFIPVFHNNFLGTDPSFKGWRDIYIRFISGL